MLQEALDKIIELQKVMGYYDLCRKDETFRMEYLRNITLATHVELTEFLQEVPWKPWSKGKMTRVQANKAAFELADVLVFTLVLWATLNPDVGLDDVLGSTCVKIEKRIKETDYERKI